MPPAIPITPLIFKTPYWKKTAFIVIGFGFLIIGAVIAINAFNKPDPLLLVAGTLILLMSALDLMLEIGFDVVLKADREGLYVRESALTSERRVSWQEVSSIQLMANQNNTSTKTAVLKFRPVYLNIKLVRPADAGWFPRRDITIPQLRLPGTVEVAIEQLEAFRAAIHEPIKST